MALGTFAGSAWIGVKPNFSGFNKAAEQGATAGGRAGGKALGKAFGEEAEASTKVATRKLSAAVGTARDAEATAAGRVRVAEKRLTEARGTGKAKASQLAAAEESLAKANRDLSKAQERTRGASEQLTAAQKVNAAAAERHAAATADADKKQSRFARGSQAVRGKLSSLAGSLKNAAKQYGALAVAGGVAAAGALAKSSITAASDAEQSLGATETVFKRASGQIIKYSETAAMKNGLSAHQYRESANLIGSLFKNQGVATDQLAGKTDKMIGRASDLAATFGGTTKESVEALSSAFKGEFNPLERYGITLKQSQVNTEAMRLANVKSTKEWNALSDAQQKSATQQATTNLIMKQSKDSAGAFADESTTLAGQTQRLTSAWEDGKVALGKGLIPILTSGLTKVTGFVKGMRDGTGAGGKFASTATTVKDAIVSMVQWVDRNKVALGALAGGVVALNLIMKAHAFTMGVQAVGGLAKYLASTKVVSVATRAWAAVQWVLNAALSANPIGLVIVGLVALGAGLVLAYKKSETFRRIVNGAWAGVKKAAKAVVDWWTGTAWPAISGFFTNIGSGMESAKDKIVGAWNSVTRKISAVKDWITNTAWPALKSTLYKLAGFIPVVAIYRNWDKITGKFKAAWVWVRDTFSLWWSGIKRIFTNPIDSAKTIVTNLLSATGLRRPIMAVWTWVRDTFKQSWAGIKKIFTDPIDSARTLIGRALGKLGLQKTFRSAVGALGRIWDGIKKKLSSPIVSGMKWLNRGFVGRLNAMLDKVPGIGANFIPKIGIPKGFASGGWTGPGGTYQPAGIVHADEFVVKKPSRRKFERDNPGTLDHINRFGTMPGYAIGGKVAGLDKKFLEQLSAFNDAAGGRFSVNSGYRSNAHQQQLYNAYLAGRGPVAARPGSSQHNRGLAADLAPSNARDTHGALAKRFGLVFTVPSESWHIEPSWARSGGSGGGGWGLPEWVKNPLSWIKGKVAGLTKGFLANKDKYGLAGHVLPAAFTAMRDAAGKRVRSAASVFSSGPAMDLSGALSGIGKMAGGVERWRPTVLQALGIMGLSDKYANSTLRRMKQESGGNPRAINNWDINARRGDPSKGLMQVIGSTFRAYAHPAHSRNIYDPLSNILASMRYARARYGSLWAAYDRAGGYAGGTNNATPGPHWVGENGPELLWFRGGERVASARRSQQLVAPSAPQVNISFAPGTEWLADFVQTEISYADDFAGALGRMA